MNSTTYPNRSRVTVALLLASAGALGLLAACSSDGNPSPSKPPVVSTGGGGHGGETGDNDAGETSSGGTVTHGGSGNRAGSGNGGSVGRDDGGAGGEAGEAGAGPGPANCPTTDLDFLNQATKAQKAPFDNTKRLGAAASLPPLP
jgi:fibronectin-binding autotransporter adhesin